ncbi:uncharacterized protein, partial [Rutidosis leptorrhynchoides]|uniref:uncharacterized protein n=2 Tax=Rutidosis leptorrhynchoides TaxID=125765 RepID=UPI003A99EB68
FISVAPNQTSGKTSGLHNDVQSSRSQVNICDEEADDGAESDEEELSGLPIIESDEYYEEYETSDEETSEDEDYIQPAVTHERPNYHVYSNMEGPDIVSNRRMTPPPAKYSGDPNSITIGTNFSKGKKEINDAISRWSAQRGRGYYVKESNKKTWVAECLTRKHDYSVERRHGIDCNWRIRVSLNNETNYWKVVVWCPEHNCHGVNNRGNDMNVSQSLVAHVIADTIRESPNYEIKNIQRDVQREYGVQIGKKKASDGKRVAMNMVYGDWESNFRELPSYMKALQDSNDGTKVRWKFHKVDGRVPITKKIFRYVFWSFGATRPTFNHSPPVVTVDAMHLRGAYKGKGIVAMVQTANGRIVPVAYAIIDEESTHSWYWFLKYLKTFILRRRVTCIISDRHKGILAAVDKLDEKFPGWGVHRYCILHVRANLLSKIKKTKGVKSQSWMVATKIQQRKYRDAWDALQNISEAACNWLRKLPIEKWTLFGDGFYRWGITTSNNAESYNNVLRCDRLLPIRAFVQATHEKAVKIFDEERTKSQYWGKVLAPIHMEKYERYRLRAWKHTVKKFRSDEFKYSVRTAIRGPGYGGNKHTVRFGECKCTCGKWETYRIPCSHAMAVAAIIEYDSMDLVAPYYTTAGWQQQFSGDLNPVDDDMWSGNVEWQLLPDDSRMVHHSGPGRKRFLRRKGAMDYANRKGRRGPSCSRCGSLDHIITGCKISRPPSDRVPTNMIYDLYGLHGNPSSDDDHEDDD